MQEGGFELPLDKVCDEHVEAGLLGDCERDLIGVFVEEGVDPSELRANRVEEGVEEDGTQIFD